MTVRSDLIVTPRLLTTAAAVDLYVPAAPTTKTIVKHVRAINVGAVAAVVSICRNAATAANAIWWQFAIRPGEHVDDDAWQVIEVPDKLVAICNLANVVVLEASGAELV